jgi:hypothetical protein
MSGLTDSFFCYVIILFQLHRLCSTEWQNDYEFKSMTYFDAAIHHLPWGAKKTMKNCSEAVKPGSLLISESSNSQIQSRYVNHSVVMLNVQLYFHFSMLFFHSQTIRNLPLILKCLVSSVLSHFHHLKSSILSSSLLWRIPPSDWLTSETIIIIIAGNLSIFHNSHAEFQILFPRIE